MDTGKRKADRPKPQNQSPGSGDPAINERMLDAISKERSGVKVISGTIGDAIDAYEAKQMARLARGEI